LMCAWSGISTGATPLESLVPQKELPKEWTLIHGPQTFNNKTLFEHVNGQAELFLKYGFEKSVFAIYQSKKNSQDQIEMDIYDVGNVVQAFGVFSRFRNEDRPGGFGLDSFLDDHSALFYKGRYFIMVYATASNRDLLKQFSLLISSKIMDPSPPPKEISYFPKNGLKPGSIQYFSEGLLGHQFLKRGFQGTYLEEVEVKDKVEDKNRTKTEGKEYKLFLAIFKDSQDAAGGLKAYRDDLSKKGKISSINLVEFGIGAFRGEDPYQGNVIILQKRSYLLGVIGFEQEKDAENHLAQFMKNIK
jgi:hypothetical protein